MSSLELLVIYYSGAQSRLAISPAQLQLQMCKVPNHLKTKQNCAILGFGAVLKLVVSIGSVLHAHSGTTQRRSWKQNRRYSGAKRSWAAPIENHLFRGHSPRASNARSPDRERRG